MMVEQTMENPAAGQRVLARVRLRLLPFLVLLFIIAYLDRINVSFAVLQMNESLGFSDAVYGLGSGIFFIGYFLFEVPSNLLLERSGARFWIARIMITWGVVSVAMMFIRTSLDFYVLRFILGLAEAGFFPGVILYLTYWFPQSERARAVSLFMTATSIAGVIGGPVSGLLLEMHGLGGLEGWQWLFLLEGLPAVFLGVVVLYYLTDRPEQAQWLTEAERSWLIDRLRQDHTTQRLHGHHSFLQSLRSGRVWLLCLLYFTMVVGFYGIGFSLPTIIKESGSLKDWHIGLLSAIPNLVSILGMVVVGGHSDRTNERRWHIALSALVGALGLVLSAFTLQSTVLIVLSLSIALTGMRSTLGPYWALPTALLAGTAAAGGLAFINSVGNLEGFVGPTVYATIKGATHNHLFPLLFLALVEIGVALLVLCIPPVHPVATKPSES